MLFARIRLALLLTGAVASAAASAAAQAPPGTVSTIKANAQLVVVDVVVSDSKGTAIHNLKASDFSVQESGAPQQITGFEEHAAIPASVTAKIPPMRPLPAGIFTNFTPVPPGTAVNVLLLDALNTQMKDQSYVMGQLREYLKNTPTGTRIAIFTLSDHLTMLQGFTSDLALLKAAAERAFPGSSRQLTDSSGHHDSVGNGGTQTPTEIMSGIAGPDMQQLISNFKQQEAWQASQDTLNRTKLTLDAMNQLAHYLAGVPGRKNLIWFSGSFPLTIFPDPSVAHPFDVVGGSPEEFRETTSLLARAQVAVYPIDARGLMTQSASISADSGPGSSGMGLARSTAKAYQDTANEHATMYQMAAATGGHAYVNDNGIAQAVGEAIDNGSNYYTLSYTPTNSKQDGGFRKIQVKLAQQGLTLSYRNGYYADGPEVKSNASKVEVNLPDKGADPAHSESETRSLARTMMRGGPPPTEILLKLQVLPANATKEKALAPLNIAPHSPAASKVKGPYRRYAIDIAVDSKDIKISQTADGHYTFSTEVLTYVYDANGAVINTAVQKARGNLDASTLANMRRVGLPFHQEVSVPADGDYTLRIAVHDLETDHYGAVELPVASVAKLAPLAVAPPAATAK
jgi:VWFA-related protein